MVFDEFSLMLSDFIPFLSMAHLYSWQCCVYTLNFRHDSTVMIRPRGYQAAQYFTLNILHPNRNQSTQSQSESYFNDSLNVSLVIQKKRTVIHNLFSFPDNSLSYKSRNLIAIHVIGRVDVSINKFFGSFLNLFWAFTLIFKEISYFTLFQKKQILLSFMYGFLYLCLLGS